MTVANHVLSFGGHLTMILVMRPARLHSSDFRYGPARALVRGIASGTACDSISVSNGDGGYRVFIPHLAINFIGTGVGELILE